jgi:polyisoprenoid-binding protein YceI
VARYQIDPDRSRVFIDARSSLHPIHSSTDGLEGYVDLDFGDDGELRLDGAPVGVLSLAVNRLSSGNGLEDREMQKRIDARRYPTIQGVLKKMQQAAANGTYRVNGEVTFRGVARPHDGEMTIKAMDPKTAKLEGQSRFDIRQFGMEPPKILMLKVDPNVDVRVEIMAVKEE